MSTRAKKTLMTLLALGTAMIGWSTIASVAAPAEDPLPWQLLWASVVLAVVAHDLWLTRGDLDG